MQDAGSDGSEGLDMCRMEHGCDSGLDSISTCSGFDSTTLEMETANQILD